MNHNIINSLNIYLSTPLIYYLFKYLGRDIKYNLIIIYEI